MGWIKMRKGRRLGKKMITSTIIFSQKEVINVQKEHFFPSRQFILSRRVDKSVSHQFILSVGPNYKTY